MTNRTKVEKSSKMMTIDDKFETEKKTKADMRKGVKVKMKQRKNYPAYGRPLALLRCAHIRTDTKENKNKQGKPRKTH